MYNLNIIAPKSAKMCFKLLKFRPFPVLVHQYTYSSQKADAKVAVTPNTSTGDYISVCGKDYLKDDYTNVTPHILSYIDRKLHLQKNHPLNILKERLVKFMYGSYVNSRGNPLFSIYDKLSPVASAVDNFDSLLIAPDHPSRKKSDTYFINRNTVLRTHTSCHQSELMKSGLDNFLVIGDCYRRDEINCTHYPVFHQVEGVKLFSSHQLFECDNDLKLFENGAKRIPEKQEQHTTETVKLLEQRLKACLTSLIQRFFGKEVQFRWTDTYFPFTHPSWEMEVFHKGEWLEILGCGIMEQKILETAGADQKVGWAFGIGLERLAMMLYNIPDIRLFWSQDSGFLSQFDVKDIETAIKYKEISKYPQCINDISFWVPENFHANDFYDLVRSVGGDLIEQVYKADEFFHPKHKKQSFSFRIIYRHMERTLTQEEVNQVHKKVEQLATQELNVQIR